MTQQRVDLTVPGAHLTRQREGIPVLRPTPLTQTFWDGAQKNELRFQRCRACAAPVFNPAPVCRMCTSDDLAWETSLGRGVVYSYTICWRPMTPAFTVPYAPVIVTLDEGFQMLSDLVDCVVEDVRVGMPVEVVFEPIGDRTLPYFIPRRGEQD